MYDDFLTQLLAQNTPEEALDTLARIAGYVAVPPTIDQFLDEDFFAGRFLGKKVFPTWRDELRTIFPHPLYSPFVEVLISGSIGSGKGVRKTTTLLTPNGRKLAADIQVGDWVSNPDGGASQVRGVYPQPKQPVYEVTFNDGSSVVVDGSHLWLYWESEYTCKRKQNWFYKDEQCNKQRVGSTLELIEHLEHLGTLKGNKKLLIPLTKPVQFNQRRECAIDPYLLGLLLGDGCLTTRSTLSVSSVDSEIQEFLVNQGFSIGGDGKSCRPVGATRIELARKLYNQKLMGTYSHTKFVPKCFKFTSIENRLALLQGLMDTDGYVDTTGGVEYTTTSHQLALDVQELISSLGGWASIRTKTGSYIDKHGERVWCKLVYRLYIQFPNKTDLFRLTRKKERAAIYGGKYNGSNSGEYTLARSIKSIEKLPEEEETVCFRVDHPNSLFLIDNYVVTHNSSLCRAGMLYDLCRLLYLTDPHEQFDLISSDKIIIAFVNTTKGLSKSNDYAQFIEWIGASPFFQQQRDLVPDPKIGRTKDLLPHKINAIAGSRAHDAYGKAIVMALLSELNFQGEHVKNQAYENYEHISRRMHSRYGRAGKGFMTPGRLWMDSSKSDETGFLENHILKMQHEPTVRLISYPIWDVLGRAGKEKYTGKKFHVFVGDSTRDPFILEGPQSSMGLPDSKVVACPVEYRHFFERNLFGALRDYAGQSTWSSAKFVTQLALLRQQLDLPQLSYKEIIDIDPDNPDDHIIRYIDWEALPKDIPYYIHIDYGKSRDRTGIALTRSVGTMQVPRLDDYRQSVMANDLKFETNLALAVIPKPGKEVIMSRLKQFIVDLGKRGVPIAGFSMDGYQSTMLLQDIGEMRIPSDEVSTDKSREPYDYWKDSLVEYRWHGPAPHRGKTHDEYLVFREFSQLLDLIKKIDHPVPTSDRSADIPSKDVTDAIVGSIFNCKLKSTGVKAGLALQEYSQAILTAQRTATWQENILEQGAKARGKNWGKLQGYRGRIR